MMNISPVEVYGNKWDKYLDDCFIGVRDTDPVETNYPVSYRTALATAVTEGLAHHPLTARQIIQWHKDISGRGLENHQAEEIAQIVKQALPRSISDITVVDSIGSLLYKIETLPFLASEGHKMAHLFINYVGGYCGQPLFVFHKEEKEQYLTSIQSASHTQALLAEKIREAVIVQNTLWERSAHTHLTDRYKNDYGETLTIQWNALVEASKKWSAD